MGSDPAGAPGEDVPAGGVAPAVPNGAGAVELGAGDGSNREGGDGWLFTGADAAGGGVAAPGNVGAAAPGDDGEPADGAPPVCANASTVQTQKATANKVLCMCASLGRATLSWANARSLILFPAEATRDAGRRNRSPDEVCRLTRARWPNGVPRSALGAGLRQNPSPLPVDAAEAC